MLDSPSSRRHLTGTDRCYVALTASESGDAAAAMLNLSFIFEDANAAMAEYADRLSVVPLPAALYMMQVDVLNHYRDALTHYFPLT
jgi:hypothetical protein